MIQIGKQIVIGNDNELVVMAGPCVIESEEVCLETADFLSRTCGELKLPYVFKASFDKANRTSLSSFRGPGMEKGLTILQKVKDKFDVPVVTDIHHPEQAAPAAEVADVIQIPAFLCRQTDLLLAAGKTGKPVNVKKGQFMAPEDMEAVLEKIHSTDNGNTILTERGTTFGYHNLVVDMRSLDIMRNLGAPVIFDCTHAVQRPGGKGTASGGNREFAAPLTRAACATGIDGLFMEVHPDPDNALSDGSNSMPFTGVKQLLKTAKEIHGLRQQSTGD